MRTRFTRSMVVGATFIALGLCVATSADAVSLSDACSAKLTAHCAPLAAACAHMKSCMASHASKQCVTRGIQDLDDLRPCAPCRSALADLEKQSATCKKVAGPKASAGSSSQPPAPTPPASAPPAPATPPPPAVGSPGVVPAIPADCKANLPQGDIAGLVNDSSWGYCAAEKLDCPCSYKPCVIGMDYIYANVLEPSIAPPESPGWSKTKVKNGQGMAEWMYCTVRSCKIAETNKNVEETSLRCWSKPL